MGQHGGRSRRPLLGAFAATLAAGVAIGALATRWWASTAGVPDAPPPPPAAEPIPPAAAPDLPTQLPPPPPGALPPEAELYPEHFQDLEGAPEPEAGPGPVEYPVADKLVREPLSSVPHRVLGAWDEAAASEGPGRRRAFVLVVEPNASDREIEALARDVLARHRDAGILDVRIYDDERATRSSRATDGGRLAFEHLVGEVKRNAALGLEVVRVRGRAVEP